jgi:hypothetical protein
MMLILEQVVLSTEVRTQSFVKRRVIKFVERCLLVLVVINLQQVGTIMIYSMEHESRKPDRLWTEWVQDYSLVIFSIGPHEISHRSYCGTAERKNTTDNFFNEFFQNDDYLNGSNTTFVWRTWGGPLTDDEKVWNQLVMGTMILKIL